MVDEGPDREGDKGVPLDDESAARIRKQLEAFKAKFGREAGPHDPVFFDPDADEPCPFSAEQVTAAMTEAMQKAGVHPELIYAYQQTGMLVTSQNRDKWPAKDRAEWDRAIDHWRAMHESDLDDKDDGQTFEEFVAEMEQDLDDKSEAQVEIVLLNLLEALFTQSEGQGANPYWQLAVGLSAKIGDRIGRERALTLLERVGANVGDAAQPEIVKALHDALRTLPEVPANRAVGDWEGEEVYGFDLVPLHNAIEGQPPLEYRVRQDQAAIVGEIFERLAAGQESPSKIAQDLNRRKVPAPRLSRRWNAGIVGGIARDERYKGQGFTVRRRPHGGL